MENYDLFLRYYNFGLAELVVISVEILSLSKCTHGPSFQQSAYGSCLQVQSSLALYVNILSLNEPADAQIVVAL